ncbi:MAG: hypothetical protein AAFO94_01765 [Bacteroidota bacterium]
MQFVSEQNIEQVIARMDEDVANYTNLMEALQERQPAIHSYLFAESFLLLSQNERELLLYLLLVVWQASEQVNGTLPAVPVEILEAAEDAHYALLEKTKSKEFRERLDPFFQTTQQEDLLAFAEDSLMPSAEEEATEEDTISDAAREPIFIAIASVVAAFTKVLSKSKTAKEK